MLKGTQVYHASTRPGAAPSINSGRLASRLVDLSFPGPRNGAYERTVPRSRLSSLVGVPSAGRENEGSARASAALARPRLAGFCERPSERDRASERTDDQRPCAALVEAVGDDPRERAGYDSSGPGRVVQPVRARAGWRWAALAGDRERRRKPSCRDRPRATALCMHAGCRDAGSFEACHQPGI